MDDLRQALVVECVCGLSKFFLKTNWEVGVSSRPGLGAGLDGPVAEVLFPTIRMGGSR